MPMLFTDARAGGNPILFANDAFLAMTQYPRDEVLGRPFKFFMAGENNMFDVSLVDEAFRGRTGGHFEMRDRRRDGSVFWAAVFTHPVPDMEGRTVDHFVSFVDLTDHKREAENLRLLLDELNHRTQNTLATVQALTVQTLRGQADPSVISTLELRILALAKTHGLLGQQNWESVTIGDVLDRVLEPFRLEAGAAPSIFVEGPAVRLVPKAALTLSLVFHELATNAVKHGALSNLGGHVAVTWRCEPGDAGPRLALEWRESGGPLVTPPTQRGFGSRLIEAGLATDLGGAVRVTYEAEGLACHIEMPLGSQANA